MGMVMKRAVQIDSRLEKDQAFYDFFVDYYTEESEARMRKMIEEHNMVFLDETESITDAMADKEYVDKAYKEYTKRNA